MPSGTVGTLRRWRTWTWLIWSDAVSEKPKLQRGVTSGLEPCSTSHMEMNTFFPPLLKWAEHFVFFDLIVFISSSPQTMVVRIAVVPLWRTILKHKRSDETGRKWMLRTSSPPSTLPLFCSLLSSAGNWASLIISEKVPSYQNGLLMTFRHKTSQILFQHSDAWKERYEATFIFFKHLSGSSMSSSVSSYVSWGFRHMIFVLLKSMNIRNTHTSEEKNNHCEWSGRVTWPVDGAHQDTKNTVIIEHS